MGVLGGWAFSYERGTPVPFQSGVVGPPQGAREFLAHCGVLGWGVGIGLLERLVQGYLAHKKQPPPRTLQ